MSILDKFRKVLAGDVQSIESEMSREAERASASLKQHAVRLKEQVRRQARQNFGSGAVEQRRAQPRRGKTAEVLPPYLPLPTADSRPKNPYLGYYVETVGGKPTPRRLHYHGQKHLLCFGSPGSNKSTGLVVPNMMMLKRSVICIDPKGQICAITRRARAADGQGDRAESLRGAG